MTTKETRSISFQAKTLGNTWVMSISLWWHEEWVLLSKFFWVIGRLTTLGVDYICLLTHRWPLEIITSLP
jgi:hypothetical protein